MTETSAPDSAVQIVWKTLADFLGPDRYRAEQSVAALVRAGWLHDPELLAARQMDHDAVVAERDELAERVAELEAERAGALDLHRPKFGEIGPECTACGAEGDPEPWPCSTMLALDY